MTSKEASKRYRKQYTLSLTVKEMEDIDRYKQMYPYISISGFVRKAFLEKLSEELGKNGEGSVAI